MRFTIVDLPLPDFPTRAIVSPLEALIDILFKTGSESCEYENVTFRFGSSGPMQLLNINFAILGNLYDIDNTVDNVF